MSMPKIPDINPEINITRQDAVNIIITSIAMEELALAHILNAEGEKLQYVLGTLENKDPGEVTICDIMEVNKSIRKTLRDVIKTELLLQLKLEEAAELDGNKSESRLTVNGQKIWRDGDNAAGTRPPSAEIILLRDGEAYRSVIVDSAGDGKFSFACLPVWRDSENKYTYQIDEPAVPMGYTKTISGFTVINTVEPGSIIINGLKIWVDDDNASLARPAEITVNLLQNGVQYRSLQLASPPNEESTAPFSFSGVPQFDEEGALLVYTVDENEITDYTKSIDGFNITNTYINLP